MRQIFLLTLVSIFLSINSEELNREGELNKHLTKIKGLNHENEAIKILNELIYQGMMLNDFSLLTFTKEKKWMKATKLIMDFLIDTSKEEAKQEVGNVIDYSNNYLTQLKDLLKDKKRNIVKISPIFEWSQDNEMIKIRLKFAKNLESPGEKNIQNLTVVCSRNTLIVHGYKVHEDYVAYYFRDVKLYDMMKMNTCRYYQETDGTYIVKFLKLTPTLYWNHLDLFTENHENMYTWFDVFTQYDDKAKYTEFREFTQDNLLEKDINYYLQEKSEEKRLREKKISQIMKHFKTKEYEYKNYCNSPVNENFCLLLDIYDWNYWLS